MDLAWISLAALLVVIVCSCTTNVNPGLLAMAFAWVIGVYLVPGSDPTSALVWDGKSSEGRTVPGGIYLYEIEFQGKVLTGTVVVAR